MVHVAAHCKQLYHITSVVAIDGVAMTIGLSCTAHLVWYISYSHTQLLISHSIQN